MFMKMSILYTDIFALGERFLYFEIATVFLMDLYINTLDQVFGCDLTFRVEVASGNSGFAVFFAYLIQIYDWFPYAFFLIVIITR